jgi:uncharacterized protein (TIGR02246 family)
MKSIVERYCDAWNGGDIDAIFALFAEDARYEGATTQLTGRNNIRKMYERTFASGEGRGLVVRPIETAANRFLVAVYSGDERVAVKQFEIIEGLIVLQSMRA